MNITNKELKRNICKNAICKFDGVQSEIIKDTLIRRSYPKGSSLAYTEDLEDIGDIIDKDYEETGLERTERKFPKFDHQLFTLNDTNTQKKFFHGVAGNIPFFDEKEVLEQSIKTLKKILEIGGIYSRNKLKEFGITTDNQEENYNGFDYISICTDNPNEDEFTSENFGLESAYFLYVKYKIAIEFKETILTDCVLRKEPYSKLPGEIQIEDFIPISSISRVLVGLEDLKDEAIYELNRICRPYNIPVVLMQKETLREEQLTKKLTSNS